MAGGTSSQNRKICTPILQYYYGSGFGPRPASLPGISTNHKGVDLESLELDVESQQQTRIFAPCHARIVKIVRNATNPRAYEGEAIYLEVQDDVKQSNPEFASLGIDIFRFFHLRPGCLDYLGLKENDFVEAGTLIGFMGRSGIAETTGIVHLHLEAIRGSRQSGQQIDPLPFLRLTQKSAKITPNVKETGGNKQTNPNFGITFMEKVENADYQHDDDVDPSVQGSIEPNPTTGAIPFQSPSDFSIDGSLFETVKDEEIALGIIPLFMDQIIEFGSKENKYENFIGIDGGINTAILPNLVLGKDISNYNVLDFTNIELSNMVPYVELYSVKINPTARGEQFYDILFPFDDYTEQRKIDSIFYDRTGRGGNIGIKSVEWESLATNMSNQSFIEAKVKIHIQDIKDISTVRNGISLLDFLYPMGTTNPEFKTKSFTVKMKAGWIFKENQTTNRLDNIELSDHLTETMYLTLTNHRFEFLEDGSVDLTLDYKGMLESLLLEQDDFNVLDYLSPTRKVLENSLNFWKGFYDIFDDDTVKGQELINKVIKLINDKNNKGVFGAFLRWDEEALFKDRIPTYFRGGAGGNSITPKGVAALKEYDEFKQAYNAQDTVPGFGPSDRPGVRYEQIGTVTIPLANDLILPSIYVTEKTNKNNQVINAQGNLVLPPGADTYAYRNPQFEEADTLEQPINLFENYELIITIETEQSQYLESGLWNQIWTALKTTYANAQEPNTSSFQIDISKSSGKQKFKNKLGKIISDFDKKVKQSYKRPLANLFNEIGINYITLDRREVDQLKKISTLKENRFSERELESILLEIRDILSKGKLKIFNNKKKEDIEEAVLESIDSKDFSKSFVSKLFENKGTSFIVPYIYVGQILDYYINLFYGKVNLKEKLNLVLGSFSYTDFGNLEDKRLISGIGARISSFENSEKYSRSFEQKYANLAEIPISVESFLSWYNSHIADSNLKKLSFLDFLKSLFNNLINANLKNNIIPFTPSRSIIPSFNLLTINEPGEKFFDDSLVDTVQILAKGGNRPAGQVPKYKTYSFRKYVDFTNPTIDEKIKKNIFYKIKKFVNQDIKEKRNMFFIFSKNEKDLRLNSDFKTDINKSILHLYVGQETGLVKSIKFTRQDNQRLESANIVKANNNQSDNMIIRQIYNLDLEMFGNTMFTPGQLVHITPTYPGSLVNNPVLYQIGLGGYYMINKISNTIEENEFITKITGQWQMHGGGYEKVVSGTGGFIVAKDYEI